MSLLRKANKKVAARKTKSAQKKTRAASARSSRVRTKQTEQTIITQAAQPEAYNKPRSSNFLTNVLRILALFAVVAITVYIYSIREHAEHFEALGYPGIFLIALLANATVLLPAPGVAVIYAMGGIFNPFGVGLAAGTGGAIGELSGYLAGFSGQAVIERTDIYNRIKPWVEKYGGWAILVLSAIPNPFFDVAGIAAGIAKMPLRTFLVFTWVGQLIKMTLFALAGRYSITLLTNFIK
ncbi:MAG TPA: VTT domain-containing protein [Anaerolineales bacterium]|nr:VTT domain-containing protein [Anaerolineales bacterium]